MPTIESLKPPCQSIKRRWFKVILAVFLLALFGSLIWESSRAHEPVYQGKPLSTWLQSLNDPGSGPSGGELAMLYGGWNSGWTHEKGAMVKEALSHMGAGLAPALQRMVRYRETPVGHKFRAWAARQNLIKFHSKSESEIHEQAAAGCALSEPALQAQLIGDWIKLVEDKETELAKNPAGPATFSDDVQEATFCFYRASRNLDASACEPLIEALTNRSMQVRNCAAGALGQFVSQGKVVVPPLLRLLTQETEELVRYNAAISLGRMLPEAETVVPALLREVRDPTSKARGVSVFALSRFTNQSAAIVPVLLDALSDTNAGVRTGITNALRRLDPDAAIRAGIK